MYYRAGLSISAPKDLIACRQFFLESTDPKQRQYEALRAYFVEGRSSQEVARAFGYSVGSFRVLCHHFRRDAQPAFFATPRHGPQTQPQKSAARDTIIALRKQNYSVYEISETLQDQGTRLSPTGQFTTRCGGLFLFVPDLVRLPLEPIAKAARLPSSKMIPAAHALRASLALKLWSIERKRHIMAWVTDEGLALFSGLNVTPKKSYLSEYASRIDPRTLTPMLAAWHAAVAKDQLFDGDSFNLDFHSVPYYGEHPVLERHYVSARSRRQPSVLVFLAQDAEGRAFCYSNADIRKGEEPEEIFRFITFWQRVHKTLPRHLVFDSRLTTYANLARLDTMGIAFITLRRRSPQLLTAIAQLPRSAWRTLDLDVPTRKFRTPRVYEQNVRLAGHLFRQIYILDLGHEQPTILLTNEARTPIKKLITRYAHRMLIENALSDAVRFFHMDALSSAVGFKVDVDMTLLVIASGLYRLLARRMRGYREAQARHIFRDLVDMPATVDITTQAVTVSFHRRAHLPILMASGLFDQPVRVPWWGNRVLRLTPASA